MKALTVRQPYAHLIVTGQKRLETRKWMTDYRGVVLIHAARSVDSEAVNRHSERLPLELDIGAIVGMTFLRDCFDPQKAAANVSYRALERVITPQERTMGHFGPGWYAWEFEKAVAFKRPIPCVGSLNLWNPAKWILDKIDKLAASDIIRHTPTGLKCVS